MEIKRTAMIARLRKDGIGLKFLFYCWFVSFIGLATLIVTDLRPEFDVGVRFLVLGPPAFVIWLLYKFAGRKVRRETKTDFANDDSETDLVNREEVNDLTDEKQEAYVTLLQLVQMKCKFAEGGLEDIDGSGSEDDIYEKKRIENLVSAALSHSDEIKDDFYRSAALHSIANLLSIAGQFERASGLIEQIPVDFIQEEAIDFLAQQRSQHGRH